jgi:integrase
LPAEPATFERFLAHLAFDGSKTNYAAAAAAVAWKHAIAGLISPTKSPRVIALMAGAKRMLARPIKRKLPLSLSLIRQLLDRMCALQSGPVQQHDHVLIRFRFFVLISFYAFLRYSDFAVLRIRHFNFFKDYVIITIPNSKCDQYRLGNTVTVAGNLDREDFCAFTVARSYIQFLRSVSLNDESLVLQSIIVCKNGALKLGNQASREVLVNQLRRALHSLVPDVCEYSLHSLRSGGATAAAGVPREELKRHGRWSSSAVDCYIEPSLDTRLSVTKKVAGLN